MNPLGEEKRRKLQSRLDRAPSQDLGQVDPSLADALGQSDPRLVWERLGEALLGARLLVAVEPGQTETQLRLVDALGAPAVDSFSGIVPLQRVDPRLRPVPMAAQEVAMTAIGLGVGRISLDRRSLLPPALVHALAAGDPWIAPWNDEELGEQLLRCGRGALVPEIELVSVAILPEPSPVVIEVTFASGLGAAQTRPHLEDALAAMASAPRLGSLDETVEFRPRLLPQM